MTHEAGDTSTTAMMQVNTTDSQANSLPNASSEPETTFLLMMIVVSTSIIVVVVGISVTLAVKFLRGRGNLPGIASGSDGCLDAVAPSTHDEAPGVTSTGQIPVGGNAAV